MAGNTRSEKHCSEHVLFGVAEMLEAVLLQLPTTCIFTSQSVCKDFRNTVQTNPQLRQRRFIDLAPDAAHLPLLTSSTLTFLKKRGAHRVDRNVYLDSGRNLCHSVAGNELHIWPTTGSWRYTGRSIEHNAGDDTETWRHPIRTAQHLGPRLCGVIGSADIYQHEATPDRAHYRSHRLHG